MLLAEIARSSEFRSATGHSVVGDRMADREMVLRFLAFRLTPPGGYRSGDFDGFLAEAMHRINRFDPMDEERLRRDFARAMVTAETVFGVHAFRKYRSGQGRKSPINKALFETVSVNLAELGQDEHEKLRQLRPHLRSADRRRLSHGHPR